jgi:rhamnulokinase
MPSKNLLAFDLGAESGRAILGRIDGKDKLSLEVVHRFANRPVKALNALYWDVLNLYGEILTGLGRCSAIGGGIDAIGIDTWGVDFALIGRDGSLLGNPRHYRDPHTEGVMDQAFKKVSRAEIFQQTGLQFMRFNSLYQLLAMARARSPLLDIADSFLMMPDVFNYLLTGVRVNEFSNATTTQLYDPTKQDWARPLMKAFALPDKIFGTIVQPGTVVGQLRSSVVSDTGLRAIPVIAPATHDTGSAVAAVPARGDSWAFISSGTWSLMGAELPAPLINDKVQEYNFTNEGGVNGTSRFLKNVMGLWLVQECRRSWERAGKAYDYDALTRLAKAATPFASIVDPDDSSFMLPPDMPTAFGQVCERTGQTAPTEPGAVIRCALESLALRYRWVLERLEELLGRKLNTIHVVGGGSQNELLCQFTADACNRPVLAGPVEATAIGNVLLQAIGLGVLGSLTEARDLVRRSFELKTFTPNYPKSWDEPYARFLRLVAG